MSSQPLGAPLTAQHNPVKFVQFQLIRALLSACTVQVTRHHPDCAASHQPNRHPPGWQTCAKIPKRPGILDLQDPGSNILEDPGSCIFIFCWDLRDLGSTATLPWDPRDLGSRAQKILVDPGDPGSILGKLIWDLADLGSYTTICHCILKIPYIQLHFAFGSPYQCGA